MACHYLITMGNQTNDFYEQSTLVQQAYWHQVYQHFTTGKINAMPSWINREKNRSSSHSLCATRIVDTSIFGEMQRVAYDIVFNHFSSSKQNPLRVLIMSVAGTGKSQMQGLLLYHEFKKVVKLTVNQRVQGSDIEESNFRALLTQARYGVSTMSEWESLIFRTPHKVNNINDFRQHSVRLCYHKEKVAELNMSKLKSLNQPIAMIKARHSLGAQTLSADDMGGLEPVITCQKVPKSC